MPGTRLQFIHKSVNLAGISVPSVKVHINDITRFLACQQKITILPIKAHFALNECLGI